MKNRARSSKVYPDVLGRKLSFRAERPRPAAKKAPCSRSLPGLHRPPRILFLPEPSPPGSLPALLFCYLAFFPDQCLATGLSGPGREGLSKAPGRNQRAELGLVKKRAKHHRATERQFFLVVLPFSLSLLYLYKSLPNVTKIFLFKN